MNFKYCAVFASFIIFSSSYSMSQTENDVEANETRKLIEHLKQTGQNVKEVLEQKDEDDFALIHYAAQMLNTSEMEVLLNEGVNPNLKGGPYNDTPLNMALANFDANPHTISVMLNLLKDHGAHPDEKSGALAARFVFIKKGQNFINSMEKTRKSHN